MSLKEAIAVFLKGAAMGAANVIPGVSGGTVAFITGIYERLIHAVKSLDTAALRVLAKGRFREFSDHIDLPFLTWLGLGIVVSILTLATLLEYLFENYEMHVWAFFFGLILASVYFVGVRVRRWGPTEVIAFALGAGVAVGVALMKPASENDHPLYLVLCGVVAMASMIIPGLSGSFVLLLLGNYQLVMIESVNALKELEPRAFEILIPVGIGTVIGLLSLSRLLAWIFKHHHDLAVSLLTGFVAGSLLVIWPWKEALVETFESGGKVKEKTVGYDWNLPAVTTESAIAVGFLLLGAVAVWWMEKSGAVEPEETIAEES